MGCNTIKKDLVELFIWLLLVEAPVHIQHMQRLQIWMSHKSANKKTSCFDVNSSCSSHFAGLLLTNKPFHCHCISELLESLSFLGNKKIRNSTNSILCWLWKANCWIANKILSFKLCTTERSFQNWFSSSLYEFQEEKIFTTFMSILTSWSLPKSLCWPPFVVENKIWEMLNYSSDREMWRDWHSKPNLTFSFGQFSGFIYKRVSLSSNIRFQNHTDNFQR